jgi:rhamnulokinase
MLHRPRPNVNICAGFAHLSIQVARKRGRSARSKVRPDPNPAPASVGPDYLCRVTSLRGFGVLDVGASGGRAVLASTDGDRMWVEEVFRFENAPVVAAGHSYWDLLGIYSNVCRAIQHLVTACPSLESIGIDTWGCDFGVLDDRGRIIGNPYTYRDPARREAMPIVEGIIGDQELFERVGTPLDSIMSVYQLKALMDTASAEAQVGARFLMMPELLNYLLTGRDVNEFTNATMTLLVDQSRRAWDESLIQRLGIPVSWFGELLEPGTVIGGLSDEVAQSLAVPRLPVVLPATHDTASAVAGMPVAAGVVSPSWAFISLGTWAICGVELSEPVTDRQVREAGFGNEGGVEGTVMLARNLVGLWIIQECRKVWERDRGSPVSWSEVMESVGTVDPWRSFIDVDDPRFGAVVPDMTKEVAGYCAETGQPVPQTMGEIAACVYVSLVAKIQERLADIQRFTGVPLEVVHAVGGGIQNRTLCQWLADAAGVPVLAGPIETTSVGNALMQFKAAGVIESIAVGRDMVRKSFDVEAFEPSGADVWERVRTRYVAATS